MPIRVLEEETGLNVAGLDKFDLNADLAALKRAKIPC